MANHVAWFEIMAGPGGQGRLHEFYGSVFGWQFDELEGGYAAVRRGDADPGIGGGVGEVADGPQVVLSIEVDDIHAAIEQVKASGGEVVQEPQSIPGIVTYATFRDPAGNVVGLMDAKVPPAE